MFSKKININGKIIGGAKTFIIAEIGSNHNQDLNKALELIDIAIDSGADAVKFQSIKPESLYFMDNLDIENVELLKKIELKEVWYEKISKYCSEKGIIFFSAPTYLDAIKLLTDNDVKLMKIASPQTFGFPELIKKVGETMLPTLMSTGYCGYSEIDRAVEVFKKTGNKDLVLLHCSSNYPTLPGQTNLDFMNTLGEMFGTLVGFSDHTLGIHFPVAAVAKGAKVIEKHLTLSRNEEGPDHFFAIEPKEFKVMTQNIREIELGMGDKHKLPISNFEMMFRDEIDMKMVVCKDLKKGDIISKSDIDYYRNKDKTGISSWNENKVLEKKVNKNIKKESFIFFSDID